MNELNDLLGAATSAVEHIYFQLPIAGQAPAYRERVYCYELYHQLRLRWPQGCPFKLNGEVDKAGHKLLRQVEADKYKPDLLVHIPGDMSGNFAAIEVKPCTASLNAIRKDLRSLALFSNSVGYQRAIYLVYGNETARAVKRIQRAMTEIGGTEKIELWLHPGAYIPAALWHQ
ncbi:hypothetical protein [Rhodoferax saidenbachensis]|uniref:Methionyl-tRNA formyltransferase-like protein n=1 Tax=Rhodoferax saidenbachensis TaxID=1484693 RepID=A0ABU1ZQZ8_9BURK|nr:hypothetical protein [Rhodoferax saidenbachensis]MDR7307942.1 hypothetical protein [Rhodoferax saidenbachensis]